MMKKQLNAYIKNIKRNLLCYDSAIKKMVKTLKQDIQTYVEENNVSDFKEIENHFGSAKAVAQEFSAGIDSSYIKSYKRKKTITTIIASIVISVFAVFIILTSYIVIMTVLNMPASVETTITYDSIEVIEE